MLYVVDEPVVGPLRRQQGKGNTVLVVKHTRPSWRSATRLSR
jgi:hypothetical protein